MQINYNKRAVKGKGHDDGQNFVDSDDDDDDASDQYVDIHSGVQTDLVSAIIC
jgi:hypothetical protein